jgi:hypothetical protein
MKVLADHEIETAIARGELVVDRSLRIASVPATSFGWGTSTTT